jgi:hypothetical protein
MEIDPRGPRLGAVIGCRMYLFIQRNPRVRPSA